jgi:hypothetical protein
MMTEERLAPKYAARCPACGSSVNRGSYRCPRCKIYFCARCGRHLRRYDWEYWCPTPECPYFERVVCDKCIHKIEHPPIRQPWWKRIFWDEAERVVAAGFVERKCFGCSRSLPLLDWNGKPIWRAP